MKKIILLTLLVFLTFGFANAQKDLYTETYPTVIRDTITVSGSTNAGSDWFINKGYSTIDIIAHNGTDWFLFTVDYDCKDISKLMVMHYGGDTTLGVYAYTGGSRSVLLPLKYGYKTTPMYKFDAKAIVGATTTRWFIQMKGRN